MKKLLITLSIVLITISSFAQDSLLKSVSKMQPQQLKSTVIKQDSTIKEQVKVLAVVSAVDEVTLPKVP